MPSTTACVLETRSIERLSALYHDKTAALPSIACCFYTLPLVRQLTPG